LSFRHPSGIDLDFTAVGNAGVERDVLVDAVASLTESVLA